ncbi:MAG: PepSY-like domain-containing protein [Planctomycetota bacterium]|jgi:uncharacterized membrane protein YkoI
MCRDSEKSKLLEFALVATLLTLVGVNTGRVFGGDDVSLSDVPQAVRTTIKRELKGAEIDGLERDKDDGKIVYEVETDGDNDIKITITENGTLLEREEELDAKDLPAAILNAVEKMFGDVDFDDVEKEYRLGRGTVYKMEVEKDMLRVDLEMKEDGTVVKKRVRDNEDDTHGSLRKVRRKFMQLRGQLKVVVIGDSRAEKGVDPRYLLGEENQKHPIAFSFGFSARGVAMAQLLCEDYFAHGSKMEWVIYGISTRVFNTYYTPGNNEDDIKQSRGYLADKAAWATLPDVVGMVEFSDIDTDDSSQWGFDGKEGIKDDISEKGERERTLRELGGSGRFIFDLKRLAMLESAIKTLAKHNVKLLAFSPPVHPISIGMPCTDDDGTNREAYDEFVAQMNALDKKYPNFYFLDVNNKGEHGLEHECFRDLDHLNIRGAKKLSLRLNDFMKSVDSDMKNGIAKKPRR